MHQYRITGRGEVEVLTDRLDRMAVPQLAIEFSEHFKGDEKEVSRLFCFLLDALAVRDADALAPADWVEIGSDDEDEDLYAEAYDAGYADALADFLASDEDDVVELHHASSYDEGFRDGSAAAFELAAEGDEVLAEDDEDELTDDDYSFRNC